MKNRFRKGIAVLVTLTFLMQSVIFTSPAMFSVYAETDDTAASTIIDQDAGTQDITIDAEGGMDSEADLQEGQSDGEQAGLQEEQDEPVLEEQGEPAVLTEEEPTAESPAKEPAPESAEKEDPAQEEPAPEQVKAAAGGTRAAAQAPSSGTQYLAFTSDIHNSDNNTAATRLDGWFDDIIAEYGHVDYMGFGGDMGAASANESQFWTYTTAVKNVVDNEGIHGFYTTGNHEYYNGKFKTTSNEVKDIYTIGAEDPYTSSGNYRVYALGTTIDWGVTGGTSDAYEQDQVDKLAAYLAQQDGTKPIIVLTHFPLHHYSSRTTGKAVDVINVLNDAAAQGLTIIYLWGHNHTLSDTFYDEIYGPGDTIPYTSSASATIQFYYAAAGCMSDSEYTGAGSASVKGKGLVIQIRDDDGDGNVSADDLGFAYYSKEGTNVTENKDEYAIIVDPVDAEGMSIEEESLTVTAGETANLTLSFTPSNATDRKVNWTSSDESVATVSASGVVTGIKPGTVTITATHVTGGYTDTCEVTVKKAPGQGVTPEDGHKYVILASDGYALTSEGDEVGYSNGSGDQVFYYYGLSGEAYTVGEDVAPDRLLWTFEASEDGTGYYIKANNGKYLNGTYEANNEGGSTGTLKLDDTKDVWIISGSTSGSTVSAHILKSTNASSTASSDKYLTHGNGDNGGDNTNIFTLRSEDNATTTTFYEYNDDGTAVEDPDDPTPVDPPAPVEGNVYKLVNQFTSGNEYLIVSRNTAGSGYALTNPGGTSSGASMGSTSVTAQNGDIDGDGVSDIYISTDATNIVWTATANSSGYNITNDGDYLEGKSGKVNIYNAQQYADRYLTYTDNQLKHVGGSNTYVIYCEDGAFTSTYNSTSNTIYIYEKTEPVQGEDPVESVALDKESLTLTEGDSETLTATVTPVTAADKSVTWTSSDETVATVDQTGKVTAVKEGTATITVTTTDGGKTAACEVTVEAYVAPETTKYVLTDKLEAGKEYLIVNVAEVGSASSRALKNPGGTSDGVQISSENGKTTVEVLEGNIIETADTDIVWTAVANGDGFYLMNGDDYLEVYQGRLRVFNPVKQAARYWTYEDNHLAHRGGSNPYYVSYSNGAFAYSSSAAEIYLFAKEEGDEPVEVTYTFDGFTWTGSDEDGYTAATADYTGSDGSKESVDAAVTSVTTDPTCEEAGQTVYTAAVSAEQSLDEALHEDSKTVAIAATGHAWGEWTVTTPATETEDGVETRVCANDPSHTETRVIPATGHVHSMAKVEAKAPTCMAEGNTAYWTCTKCGRYYSDEQGQTEITLADTILPAVDHDWGEWITLVEPTCTQKGVKYHVCSFNALHMELADIDPTGHALVETEAQAATCTAEGHTAYWTCSNCGKLFSDAEGKTEITIEETVTPMTDHTWGDWAVTTPATCEAAGEETRACSVCGTEETREVEATGHNWSDWMTVTAATCTAVGSEERVCANDPSHKETREIAVNKDAHAWGEWEPIASPTCTENGVKVRTCTHNPLHKEVEEIPATGHALVKTPAKEATCTAAGNSEYWTCGVCGKLFSDADGKTEITIEETLIPMIDHTWGEWIVTTKAACEEAGEETRTCSACGEQESRAIPATGHDWGEWTVTKPATETEEGEETRVCKNDPTHKETRSIPVLGHTHTVTKVDAAEATCEKDGNIEYWVCSGCGKYFADEDATEELAESAVVIPMTDHNWGEWQTLIEPTCTDKGVRVRSCGYNTLHKEVEELAPTGHTTVYFGAVEATCDKPGNIEYWACSKCGKMYSDEDCTTEVSDVIIPATGHDWSEWTVTKPATCSATGTEERVCANDPSHKESHEIAIDGAAHTWGEWETVTPATCTTDGVQVQHCIYNESHMQMEAIPATGHKWSEWTIVTKPTCDTAGSKTRTCEVCGGVETEDIPVDANAHDWGEWITLKAASCGEAGIEFRTCKHNSTHKDFQLTPALIHEMTKISAKEATCTKAGNVEYYVCSNCGNYYSDAAGTKELHEVTIPAMGHDMVVTDLVIPTASKVGTVTRTCTRCGETETIEIPRTKLAKFVITTEGYAGQGQIEVKWTKVAGATDYQLAYRKAGVSTWTTKMMKGNSKYTVSGSKCSYMMTGLPKDGLYQIKVRAYRSSDKTYGSYSAVKYRCMTTCTPVKATSGAKGKLTVTWAKDTSCSSHEIQYSTSSTMKNAKTVTVTGASKTSYTISGLTSGKTYYVRVRPKKVVDGKTYIGLLSGVKSVKVK